MKFIIFMLKQTNDAVPGFYKVKNFKLPGLIFPTKVRLSCTYGILRPG